MIYIVRGFNANYYENEKVTLKIKALFIIGYFQNNVNTRRKQKEKQLHPNKRFI